MGLDLLTRGHGRIVGVGGYRPRREVPNSELCAGIDSSPEWIESRSGIRSRRFAGDDETLTAMATAAGRAALEHAGLVAGRVDCVIVASMSNLVQTPPAAFSVARELGIEGAGGFDVSGACAGFCHALGIANGLVSQGEARYVLVVGAERMSDIIDPGDRSIAFMFADGAGAALVGPSGTPGIGPTVRGSDPAALAALHMDASWHAYGRVPGTPRPVMRMDGKRVFRWALDDVLPGARRALDAAGVRPDDLAAFVPHQANLRMIELMAGRLKLPTGVAIARDVVTSGNTSAASVPLALDDLVRRDAVTSGRAALLAGFGAGLNYAAQVALIP